MLRSQHNVAVYGDQDFLTLEEGTWYVHSVFEHTFNLTNQQQTTLVIVTGDRTKLLPGGLYLPPAEFTALHRQIRDVQRITFRQRTFYLDTYQTRWSLNLTATFNATLDPAPLVAQRIQTLQTACGQVMQLTGFDHPFRQFLDLATTPYPKELLWLTTPVTVQWGVDFFIGRGRGLTPSGDDFLLGWLLVADLTTQDQRLRDAIACRIQSERYTTAVGRSYLAYGLQHKFSSALLALMAYLQGAPVTQPVTALLAAVIHYGNTSGIDCLAGIMSALAFNPQH
ncbi:DUF2877 domain-containing protein [Levilactobacillus acidifarinae]|uniref:DUF2877 domain-containing protein n=1 Tax=Levilactobacillus acidifarinae DSM 19394 = JCM 15949 TaxID=1423715 RepID=A0A0R1LR78_9LACO|nr:DUF2877 domain-containing protein [Levilactobacillus acidifarinae]KRK95377.1 hypothetical protein FD25_GL001495 [Levilactobacillus acidifarinae DSM 19394]GEO70031.1 hypothetical protein LAC03_19410 [Levilactobacillus acidifarinae]